MAQLNWHTGATISAHHNNLLAHAVYVKLDGIPAQSWVAPPWVPCESAIDKPIQDLAVLLGKSLAPSIEQELQFSNRVASIFGTPVQIVQDECVPENTVYMLDRSKLDEAIDEPIFGELLSRGIVTEEEARRRLQMDWPFGLGTKPAKIIDAVTY